MRASSDFSRASLIIVSRLDSMASNLGQPSFARTIHSKMKMTSMGMNSAMSGRMALMPPASSSLANASAGKANVMPAPATAATPMRVDAFFALSFTL